MNYYGLEVSNQELACALTALVHAIERYRQGHGQGLLGLGYGLCNNLTAELERNNPRLRKQDDSVGYKVVKVLCVDWPLFTGDINFPVPSPTVNCPSEEYSNCRYRGGSMYDGDYGALRIQLLNFILGKVRESINNG